MKYLLLLTVFLFTINNFSNAQRFALLDKTLKAPILYTDSVTVEQIKNKNFPIEVKNIDTFYANLMYLKEMLEVRQRSKVESFELRAGDVTIKTNRLPYAYGDRYSIIGESRIGELTAILNLSDGESSNAKSADKIKKLMDYIHSNKSLFSIPYEIHPHIYNLKVISDH